MARNEITKGRGGGGGGGLQLSYFVVTILDIIKALSCLML